MKVGFYGGMANNCYVFAKLLERAGYDVVFIRDRNDRYAFSQPVWEDCFFTMDYKSVSKSSSFSWDEWHNVECEQKWQIPKWLVDPLCANGKVRIAQCLTFWLKILAQRYRYQAKHRSGVLHAMKSCDVLFVCGVEASILALISSVPYIIWPHGGDFRIATGSVAPPKGFYARINFAAEKILLIAAYNHSSFIGTHDALGGGGVADGDENELWTAKTVHMPTPVVRHFRLSKAERRSKLTGLYQQLGLKSVSAKKFGFVPSRIDFSWKGHDSLLRAFQRLAPQDRPHLIFSGWGNDYARAKEFVAQNKLGDNITFLPFALSKPLLIEFFKAADFVIDQFVLGVYGTAAVEALAAGCPVMMWIDDMAYTARGWEPPPIMNARSEDEIAASLKRITSAEVDLEDVSIRSQEWVALVHAPEAVQPILLGCISQMKPVDSGCS